MSTMREASRGNFNNRNTMEDLTLGCLQRIADATELMAKRHQELIDQKDAAEQSRDYWRRAHDAKNRRLIASRGQITKLKKALAGMKENKHG